MSRGYVCEVMNRQRAKGREEVAGSVRAGGEKKEDGSAELAI